MRITRELLLKKRACAFGRKEFDRVFPRGMRVTRKNLMKAVRRSKRYRECTEFSGQLMLDIIWLLQKVFPFVYATHREWLYELEYRIDCGELTERAVQYKVAKVLADELKLK